MSQDPADHGFWAANAYRLLCLLLLTVAVLFAFTRPWRQSDDIWETAATVRAVSLDVLNPANPMLDLPGDTSPRFTPYTIFWGIVMRLSGLGLMTIIGLASLGNFALFVTGLGRFVRLQFKEPLLPALVLSFMLVAWGYAWWQANAYQLTAFLVQLPYVGMFTYGLCFHALAALRSYLDTGNIVHAILYAVVAVIAFITHPITAAFLFVAAVALLIPVWRRLIVFQIVPVLALAAALLWPYFDYSVVLWKGSAEAWFKAPLFEQPLQSLGIAWLGVPAAIYLWAKNRHRFIAYGLGLCLLIYGFSFAKQILIGSRFIFYAAIFMHLALALFVFDLKLIQRGRIRWIWTIVLVLLMLPSLKFRAAEIRPFLRGAFSPPLRANLYDGPEKRCGFLRNYLGAGDVVMAVDTLAWPIPALTGAKVVAQAKGDPLINPDLVRRRIDARQFLLGALSFEQRLDMDRRYRPTCVIIDRASGRGCDSTLIPYLQNSFSLVAEQNLLTVWKRSPQ
jgi:hypothetical protein